MTKGVRGDGGKTLGPRDAEINLEGAPGQCQEAPSGPPGARGREGQITPSEEPAGSEDFPMTARAAKELTDAIATPLRAAYSELLSKPIPEKFKNLLQSLAARDKHSREPQG
jgi:hypothetical protein